MLNLIVLMGRATKDPIVRRSDKAIIANFDIAVDNIGGDDSTSFFPVTCFNKVADNVSKFVRKGSKIAITGRIQQRSYMNSKGEKRTTYDVIADSVEFLDPKPVEPAEPNPEEIPPFDNEPMDSCGSLDGEKYEDENGKEKKLKFDPYTGKPLKQKAKK